MLLHCCSHCSIAVVAAAAECFALVESSSWSFRPASCQDLLSSSAAVHAHAQLLQETETEQQLCRTTALKTSNTPQISLLLSRVSRVANWLLSLCFARLLFSPEAVHIRQST